MYKIHFYTPQNPKSIILSKDLTRLTNKYKKYEL